MATKKKSTAVAAATDPAPVAVARVVNLDADVRGQMKAVVERLTKEALDRVSGYDTVALAVKNLEVTGDETCQLAVNYCNSAKVAIKELNEMFEPYAKAGNLIHKSVTGARSEALKPWEAVRDAADRKATDYARAVKEAREEEQKLQERAVERSRETVLREADQLMGMGFVTEAEQLMEQAKSIQAPDLPSAQPEVDNARFRYPMKGRITDLKAFCRAVADGTIPLQVTYRDELRYVVEVPEAVLNAVVGRMGKALNWPGVEVYEDVKIGAKKL